MVLALDTNWYFFPHDENVKVNHRLLIDIFLINFGKLMANNKPRKSTGYAWLVCECAQVYASGLWVKSVLCVRRTLFRFVWTICVWKREGETVFVCVCLSFKCTWEREWAREWETERKRRKLDESNLIELISKYAFGIWGSLVSLYKSNERPELFSN